MPPDVTLTADYWSEHSARFSDRNAGLFWWEAGPEIERHINYKITGSPEVDWIPYTLNKFFMDKLPLAQCLSLGCGTGHLERTLARLGTFQHCDAHDVAEGSILSAQKLAKDENIDTITYHVTDINNLVLPPNYYDAVWILGAMHHFERLEHVCQQIKQTLKPEGLLVLSEYAGPSRFQFPARQKEIANLCLRLLPTVYRIRLKESVTLELEQSPLNKGVRRFTSRLIDKIRDGDLTGAIQRRLHAYRTSTSGQSLEKTSVYFPSARDVISGDPSEAVRSGEMLKVLQQHFEIIENKPWGGNVLQFLLAGIAGNFSDDNQQSQALLRMLIDIEDTLLQCGEFESDFVYIVARPLTAKVY